MPDPTNRRAFLTGRAALDEARRAAKAVSGEDEAVEIPTGGDTVRLAVRAMATEFAVVMNPGPPRQVMLASDALDLLEPLEQKMTVYREDADLVRLNEAAVHGEAIVDQELIDVLVEARRIATETAGCFDPTSGPMIELWRTCRAEGRVPTDEEIGTVHDVVGMEHVTIAEDRNVVTFDRPGVELNLGGIGKGFALDRVADFLIGEDLGEFLIHGGRSSILARGDHAGRGGWPVGIVDPLSRNRRLATLLLRDRAMSTSGSSIQYFRHEGQRYGHILDPRTGRSATGMLSVTAVAPTAAEADALSTAFFVGGVEIAQAYCDNSDGVGAVLLAQPTSGRTLHPVVIGLGEDELFFHEVPARHPAGN